MKRLLAPWRNSYLSNPIPDEGCILCKIGVETENDRKNYVLFRTNGFYIVLNRFPYINGHLMIVPLRHAGDLSSLQESELNTMIRLIVKCEKVLAEGMNCMGINGGWNLGNCAGAGIEGHIHLHMLPRWSGDANFMTTVGETRVISSSLEDSFERLKPFFEKGNNCVHS